jgi:L-iditol 2-dehydrogenase
MEAAVLKGIGEIRLEDVETPVCGDGDVLVRIDACAVCGTDVKALRHGHRMVKPPVILGHELAGTIVEVGSGVDGYYNSQRVTVASAVPCGTCYYCQRGQSTVCRDILDIGSSWPGGFAQHMLVPARAVRTGCINKIPDGVSAAAAALTEPLSCCLNAQELLAVGPGDHVLIIGSGPVGCLNAMLARALGATSVILANRSAPRLEMARVVGADRYVNTSQEELADAVAEMTRGRGADVVIVACASGEAQEQSVGLAASRGRLNFFGGLPGDAPAIAFDSNRLHYEELTLVGNHGATPYQNYKALQLIASGRVDTEAIVTHRFPLARVEEAIRKAESHEGLKVLVECTEQG